MAERKDKMSDEETLKHYKSEEGFPTPEAESELPAAAKELLEKALASKPEFVKAEIAVDPIMTNRKSFRLAARKKMRRENKWPTCQTKRRWCTCQTKKH